MSSSDFILTSKKLRQYIGAKSYAHDPQLKKAGSDPVRLREVFNLLYPRRYNISDKDPDKIGSNFGDLNLNIPHDRMFIDLSEVVTTEDLGSYHEVLTYYMLIWKIDNVFMFAKIHLLVNACPAYYGGVVSDDEMGWEIAEEDRPQPIDFVNLVQQYHHLVIQICERWSHEEVIRHIKTAETE
jgi:hypothetical protein